MCRSPWRRLRRFTGALQQREGLLELANGGTLFLDELCSMPVHLQAKLLRALEHKEFRRVGGRRRISSDFRVVVTVSEPVEELIEAGRLRPDLAYRVSGAVVHAPALRRHRGDIRSLVQAFVRDHARRVQISDGAIEALVRYDWPGNVRELKNVIDRLCVKNWSGPVEAADVVAAHPALAAAPIAPDALAEVLARHDWRVSQAARALGIPRTTLRSRMTAWGLERPAVVQTD